MTRSQRPVWLGEDCRQFDHARIHRQLLEDDRLGHFEIAVYVGLAIHAETMTGSCRPAAATLARYVNCGERRAREALDRLEAAGYIAVEVTVGKASTYRLLKPPTLARAAGVESGDPGSTITDPGTTTRGTPARGADELEPLNENQGLGAPPTPPRPAPAPGLLPAEAPSALSDEEQFGFFWQRYPARNGRRIDRAKALGQWKKMGLNDRRIALRAAGVYAVECDAGRTIARDAHRWLRDRTYLDWHTPAGPAPTASTPGPMDFFAAAVAAREEEAG